MRFYSEIIISCNSDAILFLLSHNRNRDRRGKCISYQTGTQRAVGAMVQKILPAAAAAVNRYENILINPLFMCCSPCRTSSDRGCSTRWSANCPYENTPLARYVVTTGSVLSLEPDNTRRFAINLFIIVPSPPRLVRGSRRSVYSGHYPRSKGIPQLRNFSEELHNRSNHRQFARNGTKERNINRC